MPRIAGIELNKCAFYIFALANITPAKRPEKQKIEV
jgi:hypothetical protein